MTAFTYDGAADTTLAAYDAGWNVYSDDGALSGDPMFELDGSGNVRATTSSGERWAWYTGATNDVTITEGPSDGSELLGPAIHVANGQKGYYCQINYTNGADTIVDVRMYKNGSLYGTNITPTIARQTGVPMEVTLRLVGGAPTAVLDNGVTTETLTWVVDGAALTTGNGGKYINPNFNAATTLIGGWQDNAITFAASLSSGTGQPGATVSVTVVGGDGSEVLEFPAGVPVTPDSQTSALITYTVPDRTPGATWKFSSAFVVRVKQGSEFVDNNYVITPPTGAQVGTVAGYTHAFDGPSVFDAETGQPANNIVNGDQYDVRVTSGAFTVDDAGVPTATDLPANFTRTIFDESTGTWGATLSGQLVQDLGSPVTITSQLSNQLLVVGEQMTAIDLSAYTTNMTLAEIGAGSLPAGISLDGFVISGTPSAVQAPGSVVIDVSGGGVTLSFDAITFEVVLPATQTADVPAIGPGGVGTPSTLVDSGIEVPAIAASGVGTPYAHTPGIWTPDEEP